MFIGIGLGLQAGPAAAGGDTVVAPYPVAADPLPSPAPLEG